MERKNKVRNTEDEKADPLGLQNKWNQWEISKISAELCKKADQHTEQTRVACVRHKAKCNANPKNFLIQVFEERIVQE